MGRTYQRQHFGRERRISRSDYLYVLVFVPFWGNLEWIAVLCQTDPFFWSHDQRRNALSIKGSHQIVYLYLGVGINL